MFGARAGVSFGEFLCVLCHQDKEATTGEVRYIGYASISVTQHGGVRGARRLQIAIAALQLHLICARISRYPATPLPRAPRLKSPAQKPAPRLLDPVCRVLHCGGSTAARRRGGAALLPCDGQHCAAACCCSLTDLPSPPCDDVGCFFGQPGSLAEGGHLSLAARR